MDTPTRFLELPLLGRKADVMGELPAKRVLVLHLKTWDVTGVRFGDTPADDVRGALVSLVTQAVMQLGGVVLVSWAPMPGMKSHSATHPHLAVTDGWRLFVPLVCRPPGARADRVLQDRLLPMLVAIMDGTDEALMEKNKAYERETLVGVPDDGDDAPAGGDVPDAAPKKPRGRAKSGPPGPAGLPPANGVRFTPNLFVEVLRSMLHVPDDDTTMTTEMLLANDSGFFDRWSVAGCAPLQRWLLPDLRLRDEGWAVDVAPVRPIVDSESDDSDDSDSDDDVSVATAPLADADADDVAGVAMFRVPPDELQAGRVAVVLPFSVPVHRLRSFLAGVVLPPLRAYDGAPLARLSVRDVLVPRLTTFNTEAYLRATFKHGPVMSVVLALRALHTHGHQPALELTAALRQLAAAGAPGLPRRVPALLSDEPEYPVLPIDRARVQQLRDDSTLPSEAVAQFVFQLAAGAAEDLVLRNPLQLAVAACVLTAASIMDPRVGTDGSVTAQPHLWFVGNGMTGKSKVAETLLGLLPSAMRHDMLSVTTAFKTRPDPHSTATMLPGPGGSVRIVGEADGSMAIEYKAEAEVNPQASSARDAVDKTSMTERNTKVGKMTANADGSYSKTTFETVMVGGAGLACTNGMPENALATRVTVMPPLVNQTGRDPGTCNDVARASGRAMADAAADDDHRPGLALTSAVMAIVVRSNVGLSAVTGLTMGSTVVVVPLIQAVAEMDALATSPVPRRPGHGPPPIDVLGTMRQRSAACNAASMLMRCAAVHAGIGNGLSTLQLEMVAAAVPVMPDALQTCVCGMRGGVPGETLSTLEEVRRAIKAMLIDTAWLQAHPLLTPEDLGDGTARLAITCPVQGTSTPATRVAAQLEQIMISLTPHELKSRVRAMAHRGAFNRAYRPTPSATAASLSLPAGAPPAGTWAAPAAPASPVSTTVRWAEVCSVPSAVDVTVQTVALVRLFHAFKKDATWPTKALPMGTGDDGDDLVPLTHRVVTAILADLEEVASNADVMGHWAWTGPVVPKRRRTGGPVASEAPPGSTTHSLTTYADNLLRIAGASALAPTGVIFRDAPPPPPVAVDAVAAAAASADDQVFFVRVATVHALLACSTKKDAAGKRVPNVSPLLQGPETSRFLGEMDRRSGVPGLRTVVSAQKFQPGVDAAGRASGEHIGPRDAHRLLVVHAAPPTPTAPVVVDLSLARHPYATARREEWQLDGRPEMAFNDPRVQRVVCNVRVLMGEAVMSVRLACDIDPSLEHVSEHMCLVAMGYRLDEADVTLAGETPHDPAAGEVTFAQHAYNCYHHLLATYGGERAGDAFVWVKRMQAHLARHPALADLLERRRRAHFGPVNAPPQRRVAPSD